MIIVQYIVMIGMKVATQHVGSLASLSISYTTEI